MNNDSRGTSVVRRLRTDIISGALPPETRLVEAALAERYQVSRVPVRESLRALAGEGLVVIRPYAGASVAQSPESDAEDLFEIRRKLESAMARRAAEISREQTRTHVIDQHWQAWRRRAEEAMNAGNGAIAAQDCSALSDLNVHFHRAIAHLGGSTTLVALFEQISGRIEWLHTKTEAGHRPGAWCEHRGVLDAIDDGDPGTAALEMEAHLARSHLDYLSMSKGRKPPSERRE